MKERYRSMNEAILPPENLQESVFAKLRRTDARRRLRPLAAAAMLMLMVLAFPTAKTYAMPLISELMYPVSPEMAARFTPIQLSDDKNGIRMEVVSASIHGATTEVCVSFEDRKADWLDETVFLINSEFRAYGASEVPFGGSGGGINFLEYDPETGKLTILEEMTHHFFSEKADRYLTVKENYGDKITYRVNYLVKEAELPPVELPLDIAEQDVTVVTADDHPFDGFGSRGDQAWMERPSYQLLTPGDPVETVTEEVDLMGMAYLDGQLHVQLRTRVTDDDHDIGCEPYLLASDGTISYSDAGNSFRIRHGGKKGEYMEWIFDIPESEIQNYTLMCRLGHLEYLKGPWQVTFPVTESDYVGDRDDGTPLVTEAVIHGEWSE